MAPETEGARVDRDDSALASWPFSTGIMADGIRNHDWSATPLGAIETWPPSLIFAVADILDSCFASVVVWGPERIGFYNDACIPFFGDRPCLLGRPFDLAWADIWDTIGVAYDGAAMGSSNYFEDLPLNVPRPGLPDLSWWTFSCSPIRDGSGSIGGVRATVLETTQRVRLERRQAVLIRIGDALRGLNDVDAITMAACTELGRHLGADRVAYAEIDAQAALAWVCRGWISDQHPDRGGSYALAGFGRAFVRHLSSGETAVIADVIVDPLTAGGTIYASGGIRAFLAVPLIRDGRWVNVLSVAMSKAHPWTEDEITLVTAVAERAWEAVERVRAETSLRESSRRLDAALEAARMATWNWDPIADRIEVSGTVAEVFGLKQGETIGDSAAGFERIHPDDRNRHSETVVAAGSRFEGYVSEFRIIRPDGETAWLEERAQPHHDPVTGKVGLTGLVWDVTRRKRAELASEEARREVAEELAVVTTLHEWAVRVARPSEWPTLLDEMLTATMRLLQADFGTIRMYDREDDTLTVIAHRGCDPQYLERFAAASATDERLIWHAPMSTGRRVVFDDLDADGSQQIIAAAAREFGFTAIQVTPLFDRTGAPVGALSTGFRRPHRPTDREWRLVDLYGAQVADLIGARRARDALATSEQRLRRLIEGVPQLVWRSDWDGHATWHSPQWFAYTGHTREQSLDRGWLDAMHPDDRPVILRAWSRAEESGAYECECRIWSAREKRYRWFQERAVAEPVGDGGIEWIGTSTDIDALRTLHEHQRTLLAELQNRVRQTLSRLRTIVRRTAETREEVDDYVLRLDGRLDAMARAQGPALRDPNAGVDLYEIVANELIAQQAREGERASLCGPPLRLRPGAADILALAMHELAINAVEHGALARARGRIKVTWQVKGDAEDPHLRLEWTETGCNLPEGMPNPREGFGFSLLKRTLAEDFRAKTVIAFLPRGLTCSVELPLTPRVVMP